MNTYTNNYKTRNHFRPFPTFSTLVNDILNTAVDSQSEKTKYYSRPLANITKGDNEYRIALAIPGFKKEDIKLNVDGQKLTIATLQDEKEDTSYSLREFDYGKSERTFHLPKDVDTAKINASYEAGVLSVTLPVKEEAQPRVISVS